MTGRRLPAGTCLVGVPVLGLLVPGVPLVAASVVGLVGIASVAIASPTAFILVSGVLTTAIPKAGFLVRGLPLPLMMFVLLLTAVMLRPHAASSSSARPGVRLGAAALAWLVYRLVALHLDGGSAADLLALAGWYGLPVLLLLCGPPPGGLRGRLGRSWAGRMELGVMLACAFSLVQQFTGIDRAVIPGITRAVGVDYSAKPLAFAGGSKIPSTYQNGNIFGVITALFFLLSADRVIRGRGRPRDVFIMAATAVATVLSGSRTVLIGAVVGLVVLILRSRPSKRLVVVCGCAVLSLVAVLQLSPALTTRLSGTSVTDLALVQRTTVWSRVIDRTPVLELAVGGPHWARHDAVPGLAEGIIGAVQQVGIVGAALFVGTFLAATSRADLRRWRIILIPVAVSLAADSAYLVFPTIFLPIARMFSPLDIFDEDRDDPPEADADQEPACEPARALLPE